jgi:hypothetical protein
MLYDIITWLVNFVVNRGLYLSSSIIFIECYTIVFTLTNSSNAHSFVLTKNLYLLIYYRIDKLIVKPSKALFLAYV